MIVSVCTSKVFVHFPRPHHHLWRQRLFSQPKPNVYACGETDVTYLLLMSIPNPPPPPISQLSDALPPAPWVLWSYVSFLNGPLALSRSSRDHFTSTNHKYQSGCSAPKSSLAQGWAIMLFKRPALAITWHANAQTTTVEERTRGCGFLVWKFALFWHLSCPRSIFFYQGLPTCRHKPETLQFFLFFKKKNLCKYYGEILYIDIAVVANWCPFLNKTRKQHMKLKHWLWTTYQEAFWCLSSYRAALCQRRAVWPKIRDMSGLLSSAANAHAAAPLIWTRGLNSRLLSAQANTVIYQNWPEVTHLSLEEAKTHQLSDETVEKKVYH